MRGRIFYHSAHGLNCPAKESEKHLNESYFLGNSAVLIHKYVLLFFFKVLWNFVRSVRAHLSLAEHVHVEVKELQPHYLCVLVQFKGT